MIDSHTHLFLCERGEDELVASAREEGVGRMLNVGLGGEANEEAIAGAERHDEVFASVGCHPTSATGFDDAQAEEISRLAAHERVRAIGETGIDYYRESASAEDQRRAFVAQIGVAREHGMPVVIHARDPEGERTASDEAFRILDQHADGLAVILHCFLAPWRVEDAIERGWHCSFSGIVTYPAADQLREAAETVPDELLLVETDAPYLAPQPVRGRPNEPRHVTATARAVAELRGVAYEDLEATVEANARALFDW